MATTEVVILSSSPLKQTRSFEMSSSPGFPSPSELFRKKGPVLRAGSGAAPIPQNATSSFTTASSLFKKDSSDAIGVETFIAEAAEGTSSTQGAVIQSKMRKTTAGKDGIKPSRETAVTIVTDDTIDGPTAEKKARKRPKMSDGLDENGNIKQKPPPKSRAKKAVEYDEDGNVKEKPPPKPRVKKAVIEYDEDGNLKQQIRKPRARKTEAGDDTIKEKAVRKPRAKKMEGETQTKIPKGQISKPSTTTKLGKADESTRPMKPESTSKHFTTTDEPFEVAVDHTLAPAAKRRTDWTPPRPTPTLEPSRPDDDSPSKTSEERNSGFSDLFGSFGFNNAQGSTANRALDGPATKKRKLVELLKRNPISEAASAPKEKVIKKKARTLTDLATSAYAPEEELVEQPAPILQYFAYQTTERPANDGFIVPSKPRSRSPVKKAGKGTKQAPILLSPESALKQVVTQDFVFGTSSQLAREESPTFLRDIHAAMQASNELDDPFSDSFGESTTDITTQTKLIAPAKRNLWSAASRDAIGGLTDVDMVDMVESPAVSKRSEPPRKEQDHAIDTVNEEIWHDIDENTHNPPPSQQPQKHVGPIEAVIRNELSSSPAVTPKKPAADKASKSKGLGIPVKKSQTVKPAIAGMPDYAAKTTAELTKAIAAYRFKPIKSRDQMITMLERCWESKQRLALGTLPTNTLVASSQSKDAVATKNKPPSQMADTSPKRPRGRPRKDGSTSPPKTKSKPKVTDTIENLELDSDTPLSQIRTPKKSRKKGTPVNEDISDSDTHKTPSPPRRHPSQIRTTPLALHTSPLEEGLELSPKSSQVQLFKYITRAITKAPPTKNPTDPSWHEKILLFDPIVLEDLTVWLNTGGLEKVGWDGEVEPKEVKKWCESKSICCLWKENLRGGARSRY